MSEKPRTMLLKPRFTGDHFDGYDQVAGTVCCDDAGTLYGVVRIEDYDALKTNLSLMQEVVDAATAVAMAAASAPPTEYCIMPKDRIDRLVRALRRVL